MRPSRKREPSGCGSGFLGGGRLACDRGLDRVETAAQQVSHRDAAVEGPGEDTHARFT